MNEAEFGHAWNLCTFETMARAFSQEVPGLSAMAEVAREIDLRDERYMPQEVAGIDAVLKGWLLLNLSDAELEQRGIAMSDDLFESLAALARWQSS